MKKVNLLGIQVSTGAYTEYVDTILRKARNRHSDYTCVANVHMLVEAYLHPPYARVVKNAGVITPDGKPLSWALQLLHGIRQERVPGMDLLPDLLSRAEAQEVPVFFYGQIPSVLEKTYYYLRDTYPRLKVAGLYSPPFRDLSPEEEEEVIDTIHRSGARLVFVMLGCPKQEKWMAGMKDRIQATMVGVGGALPVMIGLQKRAPMWMQKAGMEWLFRLLQEPARLFKRYAVTNTVFLLLLGKAWLRRKLFPRHIRTEPTL